MRILILCTGNSCRSQMAETFLQSFDEKLEVFSAGTKPEKEIHPLTIKVMNEIGFNLRKQKPENVNKYINKEFDFVITVCDDALALCPVFTGTVKNKIHIGFEDPAQVSGNYETILTKFREVRDKIKKAFLEFYLSEIKPRLLDNKNGEQRK